jgi:dTDP-4-dehydrorhamnose reductase
MKRILICGSNGLLGQRLAIMLGYQTEYEVLNTSRHRSFVFDHKLFDYTQLDITHKGDVKSLVSSFQPDVILNAAAATNVDWCETNRELAWLTNATAIENLAEAARKVNAKVIHVSTDYVFDGKNGPYDELALPNPISYYGKAKLAGENILRGAEIPYAILRTIVVYGAGIGVKSNFALWVWQSLKSGKQICCVDDQISNPTHVLDLALAMVKIFELNKNGLFHVCGSERVSRYEFAVRIAEVFGLDATLIQRIQSTALVQPAPRPRVTGFITLKAATELGLKFMNLHDGIQSFKRDLEPAHQHF